jgi:hypothetical protein
MKARGNTKIILQKVGQIQNLIGEAKAFHQDDRDQEGFAMGQRKLEEAFRLCVKITELYEPVQQIKDKEL